MFSTRFYLDNNPDVAVAGICPLVHYVRAGGAEDRQPHPLFDPRFYRDRAQSLDPAENPLIHFLLVGSHHRRNPSAWFDIDFYLGARPDVAAAGENALVHYVTFGWRERADPHPGFDVDAYVVAHPEVGDREPISHYLTAADTDEHATRGTDTTYAATIVIPLLRQRDEWLEASVRSALAQTIPCEVVVVTSPMTPPSNLAVLAGLADDRLVVLAQRRPGFAAAMNTGSRRRRHRGSASSSPTTGSSPTRWRHVSTPRPTSCRPGGDVSPPTVFAKPSTCGGRPAAPSSSPFRRWSRRPST